MSNNLNESMRVGFGRGVVKAGELDQRVVVLSADLGESTQMASFQEKFGDRYIEVGVAEQNLVTVASGLALAGKKPFVASYAVFSPGRNWEQIRTTISLNDRPVTIIGSHAGLNVGPDGATHQMLEDIALMRALPNMTVIAPGDSSEAEQVAIALGKHDSPAYVRLAREKTPVFLDDQPFEIGRAKVIRQGHDVSLFGTGTMTYQLVEAAKILEEKGVSAQVVHFPTIKPIDRAALIENARRCGRVVVAEEAQIAGGFGGAVAEILSEELPMPIKRIGVKDRYGQSGGASELMVHYELTANQIARTVEEFIQVMPQYHR